MKQTVFGIATIPSRSHLIGKVIDSIYEQADVIEIALNGWDKIPFWMTNFPKINPTLCTNEMGDANKFLNVEKYPDAYYFSIDDDIIYPSDYVETYLAYLKEVDAVISIHGSNMPDMEIGNYYKGRIQKAHCLNKCESVYCDIIGSGVAAFDTSVLKLKYSDFTHPNMADIFLSMAAHKQGIPRLAIKHEANWITGKQPKPFTIYDKHKNDCQVQTDLVNNFNWKCNGILHWNEC